MYKWFLLLLIFGFTGCIKEKKKTPHERLTESLIQISETQPALHFRFKRLIDKYQNDNETTKQVLAVGRTHYECLTKNELPRKFWQDKQNRGGWIGWTVPEQCEDIDWEYTEIKWDDNGNAYVIIEDKRINLSECGGYPFPEDNTEIRPDSYYINKMADLHFDGIECHKEANRQLDDLNLD